ncbi:MAG: HEAT repeat domain-containing protein, partial [Candidatus Omnitrophica bacterium]|nr:HEAT repeat domain-containing protein [Candidatus Omnitrophota bacterium]
NCMHHADSNEEMSAIVKLINDPDEGVARVAIRQLGKSNSRFAFIHLIPKLSSDDMKIRKEAIDALRPIIGTDFGYKYSAPLAVREEAVKRWKKMWQDNQTNPRFLWDLQETNRFIKDKYLAKPAAAPKPTASAQKTALKIPALGTFKKVAPQAAAKKIAAKKTKAGRAAGR